MVKLIQYFAFYYKSCSSLKMRFNFMIQEFCGTPDIGFFLLLKGGPF
jgi:hypothetical protein